MLAPQCQLRLRSSRIASMHQQHYALGRGIFCVCARSLYLLRMQRYGRFVAYSFLLAHCWSIAAVGCIRRWRLCKYTDSLLPPPPLAPLHCCWPFCQLTVSTVSMGCYSAASVSSLSMRSFVPFQPHIAFVLWQVTCMNANYLLFCCSIRTVVGVEIDDCAPLPITHTDIPLLYFALAPARFTPVVYTYCSCVVEGQRQR